jgi:uncharacterized iron-regulated membrane protein
MTPNLYRSIWRWHFYAGLFVMPFVLFLSVTGAAYLFKPQIDRWEERAYRALPVEAAVSPVAQVAAARAAFPGARFNAYRLPEAAGDAAMIHLAMGDGSMRDVFVSPGGRVLGSLDADKRITRVIADIHGNLLLGKPGDWLVELAASWAIVMILTGLYLWWPRGRGLAGVVWPRARAGLRDVHAVTGFWVAGLALVMLASGLPWAGAWGSALKAVRGEFGWVKSAQEWKVGAGGLHAEHDHAAMEGMTPLAEPLDRLPAMVAAARAEGLAFPAMIKPPGASSPFGAASADWQVKSEAQNRTLQRTISFDPMTGRETGRTGFADKHVLDRVVGYGISWHEGALFGWVNQLIGVMTAGALITIVVTSFLMWRRRRPSGVLGAPPVPLNPAPARGVAVIVLGLCALLPLLALSLATMLLVEWAVLRRVPATRRWLGLAPA